MKKKRVDIEHNPELKSLDIFDVMRKPVTFDLFDEAVKKAIG